MNRLLFILSIYFSTCAPHFYKLPYPGNNILLSTSHRLLKFKTFHFSLVVSLMGVSLLPIYKGLGTNQMSYPPIAL